MRLALGLGFSGATNRGGGPVAKTYAEFRTHIAALATSGVGSWSNDLGLLTDTAKAYRITAAAETGGLYGSSWNQVFALNAGTFCRVIQHALPNKAIFDAQVAGGLELFVQTAPAPDIALNAVLRNGFQSDGDGVTVETRATFCVKIIRWDPVLNKAFVSNPSVGGAETEYTW